MTTALLVVDMQVDYLSADGLTPSADVVTDQVGSLLASFRAAGLPIAHIRTAVSPDGLDAMPHRRARPRCVVGTPGIEPPPSLYEHRGELVVHKQYFRGFVDPALDRWLVDRDVTHLVVAGVHTHACIRETALDAYERGFNVAIAVDAIASDAPAHAAHTLEWIGARAAALATTPELLSAIRSRNTESASKPRAGELPDLSRVRVVQKEWATSPLSVRVSLLEKWATLLERETRSLSDMIVQETGKPITMASQEIQRAVDHIHSAISLSSAVFETTNIAPGISVNLHPVGIVAAVMPWNNSVALPVSKIAPALICGNAVVFKPSPLASLVATRVVELLTEAGMPLDLVKVVHGGSSVGQALVRSSAVDAVTVTGSIQTGRSISIEAARLGKAVQAELGGNNAAIVWSDADLDHVIPALALNAYSFAGQRCTAVRRFVVHAEIVDDFISRMSTEIARLRVGNPSSTDTTIGPVVDGAAAMRILNEVEMARAEGAEIIVEPVHTERGGWHFLTPALVQCENGAASVVQNESFGPLAVVQTAHSVEHALELANGVEQGLVMFVCAQDPEVHAELEAGVRTGIVSTAAESLPVHPDAPFSGWKASGIGTPEHGVWDLAFYLRPQTHYRSI